MLRCALPLLGLGVNYQFQTNSNIIVSDKLKEIFLPPPPPAAFLSLTPLQFWAWTPGIFILIYLAFTLLLKRIDTALCWCNTFVSVVELPQEKIRLKHYSLSCNNVGLCACSLLPSSCLPETKRLLPAPYHLVVRCHSGSQLHAAVCLSVHFGSWYSV